ncbi:hypothetical protein [Kutzneria kofuensis]|uniref:WXG100-like domain-containing protein n=1 Tax=Kutzneria kofuensis TaxID=103725 RepID=UPI0031E61365
MTTHLSPKLQHLLKAVVGMEWPEGDEHQMWDLADAWREFQSALEELKSDVTSEAAGFDESIQGEFGDSLQDYFNNKVLSKLPDAIDAAGGLAKALDNGGSSIQEAKIMIIAALSILAASLFALALSIFGSLFTGGVIAAARVSIGAALNKLLSELMEVGIARLAQQLATRVAWGAGLGAGIMGGLEAGIQGGQIAAGHRHGFDLKSFEGAVIGGAIGGAFSGAAEFAGGLGRGLGAALPKGIRPFGKLGSSALQIGVVPLSNIAINKALHQKGSPADGMFGAFDHGGGSHPDVPRVEVPDVKSLPKVDFSGSLPKLESPAPHATTPMRTSDGKPAGTAFSQSPTTTTGDTARTGDAARTGDSGRAAEQKTATGSTSPTTTEASGSAGGRAGASSQGGSAASRPGVSTESGGGRQGASGQSGSSASRPSVSTESSGRQGTSGAAEVQTESDGRHGGAATESGSTSSGTATAQAGHSGGRPSTSPSPDRRGAQDRGPDRATSEPRSTESASDGSPHTGKAPEQTDNRSAQGDNAPEQTTSPVGREQQTSPSPASTARGAAARPDVFTTGDAPRGDTQAPTATGDRGAAPARGVSDPRTETPTPTRGSDDIRTSSGPNTPAAAPRTGSGAADGGNRVTTTSTSDIRPAGGGDAQTPNRNTADAPAPNRGDQPPTPTADRSRPLDPAVPNRTSADPRAADHTPATTDSASRDPGQQRPTTTSPDTSKAAGQTDGTAVVRPDLSASGDRGTAGDRTGATDPTTAPRATDPTAMASRATDSATADPRATGPTATTARPDTSAGGPSSSTVDRSPVSTTSAATDRPGITSADRSATPSRDDRPADTSRSADTDGGRPQTESGPAAGGDRPDPERNGDGPPPDSHVPEDEEIDLPDVPAMTPLERLTGLPDPSSASPLGDVVSAPDERISLLQPQVQTRVNELTAIARGAGLPESQWHNVAESARAAARQGEWGHTAARLDELRAAVGSGVLDRRLEDFRNHARGGFERLRDLGVREDTWQAKVDAVEQAQRKGQPALVDSALREYTAFIERHLPAELLTGDDAPRSYDALVEQLRRELVTVSDPQERERLQHDLDEHQRLHEALDRLARSDPEAAHQRRRFIEQQEEARSAEEAAQARQALADGDGDRERGRSLDDVRAGKAEADRERRFAALLSSMADDPRGTELRQRLDAAATEQERAQALREWAEHNRLTSEERLFNDLLTSVPRSGDAELEAQRAHLHRLSENATTPEEARAADQARRELDDRLMRQREEQRAARLRAEADAHAKAADDDLRQRINRMNGGIPHDPHEAELRQRLDAATTEQERAQALRELVQHKQAALQHRVNSATTERERAEAFAEQAKFNDWTPLERRLAKAHMGDVPEADPHRARLQHEAENARTPEEERRAVQALTEYLNRQSLDPERLAEEQRRLEERLVAGPPLPEDLHERFEALRSRDDGAHLDPHEAELMRRSEAADSPEAARGPDQALRDYRRAREQQQQAREQERLAQVHKHEQEVADLRDKLARERRTGAVDHAAKTQQRLERAQERLAAARDTNDNMAALRHELRQQVEKPESDGRLDRLVQRGRSSHVEQELERRREEQEFLRLDPVEPAPHERGDVSNAADSEPHVGDRPSDELGDKIAAGIKDALDAHKAPSARHSDGAGSPHREAPPHTAEPGSEVAQLQAERPRSAESTEDIDALPSATGPRVDKATMHLRVPDVTDLDRALSDPDHHDAVVDSAADSPARHDVPTELVGQWPHAETHTPGLSGAKPEEQVAADLPHTPASHVAAEALGGDVLQRFEALRAGGDQERAEVRSPEEVAADRAFDEEMHRRLAALREEPVTGDEAPAEHVAARADDNHGFAPDPELARFADREFGKLDERTAAGLWGEATQIIARHTPFDLTIGRPGGGMRERSPEQFWATMRVAQVLHRHTGAADRFEQAIAAARDVAHKGGADLGRVTVPHPSEPQPQQASHEPEAGQRGHTPQEHPHGPEHAPQPSSEHQPPSEHRPPDSGPPSPVDWAERARAERPKVDGDINGEPIRRAILDLLHLRDRPVDEVRESIVRTKFSDENLKAMFHRAVDGGFVVDLGSSSRSGPQIRLEVSSLGTPIHETRAKGDFTGEHSPEESRTALANTRSSVFTEARNLRVPVLFAAVNAKVAGLFNARGADLKSTVTHKSTTKVTETGVPGTRATHDVMFRVNVRKPRTWPWTKDRTFGDVVPVETTLLWPDTHEPLSEPVGTAPLERPQDIVHAEFSGLGDVYRRLEQDHGFPPSSQGARRLRDWLHSLPATAPELLGGKPARASFKFPGIRDRIEVIVAVADTQATHATVDHTGTIEHVRESTTERDAGTSLTRRWGGGVGVAFGDITQTHVGGGIGPIVLGYGMTKVETRNVEKTVHQVTDKYQGPVQRQRVRFDFVVKVGESDPAFRVGGAATVWRKPEDAVSQEPPATPDPATHPSHEPLTLPSTVDAERLLDRVDAVRRLPEETISHLVGSTLHRLSREGLVKAKRLPKIEQRLRRFLADYADELARGGDGARFPLSSWHKNAPDVFVRVRPDVTRPEYLGATGESRSAKVGGGHQDAVQITKGTDISAGITAFIYDNESVPAHDVHGKPTTKAVDSVGSSPGIAYKGNVREVTDIKHEAGRVHELAADGPLHRVRFPAEFEVRVGGRWAHPGKALNGGGLFSGHVEVVAQERAAPVAGHDEIRPEGPPQWHDGPAPEFAHRPAYLPPGFQIDSLKPVPELLPTVTKMIDAPPTSRFAGWFRRPLVGSSPARFDEHKGAGVWGREPHVPDERNAARDALETFTSIPARLARFERSALYQDTAMLRSHNRAGLAGSRERVARVDLATHLANPKILGVDETHRFAVTDTTGSDQGVTHADGWGVKVKADVWDAVPLSKVTNPLFSIGGSAGYVHAEEHARGLGLTESATRTRTERGYLVRFDATYGVRAESRHAVNVFGAEFDWKAQARAGEKWVHVPEAATVWIPAGEIHRIGHLPDDDLSKLAPEDAARYHREHPHNNGEDQPDRTVRDGDDTAHQEPEPVRAPADTGHGTGRVEVYRPEAGVELLTQVGARLKEWTRRHEGSPRPDLLGLVKQALTRTAQPSRRELEFGPLNERLVRDVLGPNLTGAEFSAFVRDMLGGGRSVFLEGQTAYGKVEQLVVLRAKLGLGEYHRTVRGAEDKVSSAAAEKSGMKVTDGVATDFAVGVLAATGPSGRPGTTEAGYFAGGYGFKAEAAHSSERTHKLEFSDQADHAEFLHDLHIEMDVYPYARSGHYRKYLPWARRLAEHEHTVFDLPGAVRSSVPLHETIPADGRPQPPIGHADGSLRDWQRDQDVPRGFSDEATVHVRPFDAPQLFDALGDLGDGRGGRPMLHPRAMLELRSATSSLPLRRHLPDLLSDGGHVVHVAGDAIESVKITADVVKRELVRVIDQPLRPEVNEKVAAKVGGTHKAEIGPAVFANVTAVPIEDTQQRGNTMVADVYDNWRDIERSHGNEVSGTQEVPRDGAGQSTSEQDNRHYVVRLTPQWTIEPRYRGSRAPEGWHAPVHTEPDRPITVRTDRRGLADLGLAHLLDEPAPAEHAPESTHDRPRATTLGDFLGSRPAAPAATEHVEVERPSTEPERADGEPSAAAGQALAQHERRVREARRQARDARRALPTVAEVDESRLADQSRADLMDAERPFDSAEPPPAADHRTDLLPALDAIPEVAPVRDVPLTGLEIDGLRLRESATEDLPDGSHFEVVDEGGVPLPDVTVSPREHGRFVVTGLGVGALDIGRNGRFLFRSVELPGTDRVVRFETPTGVAGPRLAESDGLPTGQSSAEFVPTENGGLVVRMPGLDGGEWHFDAEGRLRRHELPLIGDDLGQLAGLSLRIEHDPAGGVTRSVAGGVGAGFAFRVEPLPAAPAGELGDGFTVVDRHDGRAFHFDADRRLRSVDLPPDQQVEPEHSTETRSEAHDSTAHDDWDTEDEELLAAEAEDELAPLRSTPVEAPHPDEERPTLPNAVAGGQPRAIYRDATYFPKAQEFEARLGAFAFDHPRALRAARHGVSRLFDVLAEAFPEHGREEVAKVFFKDDPSSAGQVGERDAGPADLQELLERGNVRELMTAFFNAAFFKDSPLTLKALLSEIAEHRDWTRAERLGLNVPALRRQAAFLRGGTRSRIHAVLGLVAPGRAGAFDKDFFSIGNVVAQSGAWKREVAKYWGRVRRWRPEDERLAGHIARTPGEWARLGIGLSEREREFLAANPVALQVMGFRTESVALDDLRFDERGEPVLDELRQAPGVLGVEVHRDEHRRITGITRVVQEAAVIEDPRAGDLGPGEHGPELPLGVVSGKTNWAMDPGSSLYRQVHDERGMPLLAGVSGTAAKLGNAFKLLGAAHPDPDGFALSLLGWMLPTEDHSLYEILAGLQTADVVPSLAGHPLDDAAEMYRSIPGVPLAELRQRVGADGMLPHEAAYRDKLYAELADGGFREPGEIGLGLAERRRDAFQRLRDDPSDPLGRTAADWLRDNGMTAGQVLDRLSPAHFAAFVAYTGPAFPLINVLLDFKSGGAWVRRQALGVQIKGLLDKYLDPGDGGLPILPSTLADDPLLGNLLMKPTSAMTPKQLAEHKTDVHAAAEALLPSIEKEMAAHTAMLLDALAQLPPARGEVWRGTRSVGDLASGIGRLISPTFGGSKLSFTAFASFSREESEARRFMHKQAQLPLTHRVLIRAKLSGNRARDISVFAVQQSEREVLLLPGARMKITSRRIADEGNRADGFELIEAVEELPEFPVRDSDDPADAVRLRDALQRLSGSGPLLRREDLEPLARRIGARSGLDVWQLAGLAGDVHGGPEHLTVDGLTTMRRTADLARRTVKLGTDTQVTGEHLDTLVRRLDGAATDAAVDREARQRLVDLVARLKVPGRRVSFSQLAAEWNTRPQRAMATSHAPVERTEVGDAPPELVEPVPDPVRPEQWSHRREGAPSSELRTERFDPTQGVPAGDGLLPGRHTLIRAWVRRVQADDGRWVRSLTLNLPVRFGEGTTPDMLPVLVQRWRAAVDRQFNGGLLLPRSGDQLHVDLRLTPAADGREAIELSMPSVPERSDQLHFRLSHEGPELGPEALAEVARRNDLLVLHELGHFVGLPDTYLDPDSLFRDTAAKAASDGIMADITRTPEAGVPRRYLEAIENAIDSGPVVRDHPLSADPSRTGRPDPVSSLDDSGPHGPAMAQPARSALDQVLHGDAGPGEPDLVRIERLIAQARRQAVRAGVPPHSLHQGAVALRSAAYDRLLHNAQAARQAYLDKGSPVQGGFTVMPDGVSGWHVGLHNGTGLRTAFDADGRWTLREFQLADSPASMAPDLRVAALRSWDDSGQENLSYQFSRDDATTADLEVAAVPSDSPEHVYGPLVVTDVMSGHRYHFGQEGTFTVRDVPVYREAYLRTDVLGPDDVPRLVDPRGAARDDWTVERAPDGRVIVRPAAPNDAPRQRMVVDPGNGIVEAETVPLRDEHGRLTGYADVDRRHASRGNPIEVEAARLDLNGDPVADARLTARIWPDGRLTVSDEAGRPLAGRETWGRPVVEPPSVAGSEALRTLYEDVAYDLKAQEFEANLGTFAANHPRALRAARLGVSRLFDVLAAAFPDRGDEVAAMFLKNSSTDLQDLLGRGDVRELMAAFSHAAFDDSPVTLTSLLSEIVERGDWERADGLGLDVPTLRRQAPPLSEPNTATAEKVGNAFKLLDVVHPDPDGVALSVLGSMLPDHGLKDVLARGCGRRTCCRRRPGTRRPTRPECTGPFPACGCRNCGNASAWAACCRTRPRTGPSCTARSRTAVSASRARKRSHWPSIAAPPSNSSSTSDLATRRPWLPRNGCGTTT